jgi:hypothetical protein
MSRPGQGAEIFGDTSEEVVVGSEGAVEDMRRFADTTSESLDLFNPQELIQATTKGVVDGVSAIGETLKSTANTPEKRANLVRGAMVIGAGLLIVKLFSGNKKNPSSTGDKPGFFESIFSSWKTWAGLGGLGLLTMDNPLMNWLREKAAEGGKAAITGLLSTFGIKEGSKVYESVVGMFEEEGLISQASEALSEPLEAVSKKYTQFRDYLIQSGFEVEWIPGIDEVKDYVTENPGKTAIFTFLLGRMAFKRPRLFLKLASTAGIVGTLAVIFSLNDEQVNDGIAYVEENATEIVDYAAENIAYIENIVQDLLEKLGLNPEARFLLQNLGAYGVFKLAKPLAGSKTKLILSGTLVMSLIVLLQDMTNNPEKYQSALSAIDSSLNPGDKINQIITIAISKAPADISARISEKKDQLTELFTNPELWSKTIDTPVKVINGLSSLLVSPAEEIAEFWGTIAQDKEGYSNTNQAILELEARLEDGANFTWQELLLITKAMYQDGVQMCIDKNGLQYFANGTKHTLGIIKDNFKALYLHALRGEMGEAVEIWQDSGGGFLFIMGAAWGITATQGGPLRKVTGSLKSSFKLGTLPVRVVAKPAWSALKNLKTFPRIAGNLGEFIRLFPEGLRYGIINTQKWLTLDPKKQKALLDVLQEIATKKSDFWKTHNPGLISRLTDKSSNFKYEKWQNRLKNIDNAKEAIVMKGYIKHGKIDQVKTRISELKQLKSQKELDLRTPGKAKQAMLRDEIAIIKNDIRRWKECLQKAEIRYGIGFDNLKEADRIKLRQMRGIEIRVDQTAKNLADEVLRSGKNSQNAQNLKRLYEESRKELVRISKEISPNLARHLAGRGKFGSLLKFSTTRQGAVMIASVAAMDLIRAVTTGQEMFSDPDFLLEAGKDLVPVWGTIRDGKRLAQSLNPADFDFSNVVTNGFFFAAGLASDILIAGSVVSFGATGALGAWARGMLASAKGLRASRVAAAAARVESVAESVRAGRAGAVLGRTAIIGTVGGFGIMTTNWIFDMADKQEEVIASNGYTENNMEAMM